MVVGHLIETGTLGNTAVAGAAIVLVGEDISPTTSDIGKYCNGLGITGLCVHVCGMPIQE